MRTSTLTGRLPPTGIDFAFLQHAQQLDLHVEAQLADFVEEQRAAIGFLELAQMLVGGAGERALLVAEQDRFDRGSPGIAPQLTVTNGLPARSEEPWIARAISSLPTPDSPSIRIGMLDCAAR